MVRHPQDSTDTNQILPNATLFRSKRHGTGDHQRADAVRIVRRKAERDRAAPAVADEVRALDPERVHEPDHHSGMVGPHRPLDDLLVRSAILKKVRHDAAPISGEHARYDAEIGPGGAGGAAAMEQKKG